MIGQLNEISGGDKQVRLSVSKPFNTHRKVHIQHYTDRSTYVIHHFTKYNLHTLRHAIFRELFANTRLNLTVKGRFSCSYKYLFLI